MKFSDRLKIVQDYKAFLEEQNSKNDFTISDEYLNFVGYLDSRGLLNDPPSCSNCMNRVFAITEYPCSKCEGKNGPSMWREADE